MLDLLLYLWFNNLTQTKKAPSFRRTGTFTKWRGNYVTQKTTTSTDDRSNR